MNICGYVVLYLSQQKERENLKILIPARLMTWEFSERRDLVCLKLIVVFQSKFQYDWVQ